MKFGELLQLLKDDDLVIITADHGNDPTYTEPTTRERKYRSSPIHRPCRAVADLRHLIPLRQSERRSRTILKKCAGGDARTSVLEQLKQSF